MATLWRKFTCILDPPASLRSGGGVEPRGAVARGCVMMMTMPR